MASLSPKDIRRSVWLALAEDLGRGDVTTLATVPEDARAKAVLCAREPLVVAGLPLAEAAFRRLAPATRLSLEARDGQAIEARQVLLKVEAPARALLSAERVALNFLQRLSGIATLTARFVEAAKGTGARILDTRKTTPGWRRLEKYAVLCGGGHNHRFGLFDMVLIKDNHLVVLRNERPNAIAAAVRRARTLYPALLIEVEADNLQQVSQAVEAGADRILLDNMAPAQLRDAVALCNGKVKTEASGGITLSNIRAIAQTGVDFISAGALTHSARAMDIGMDFEFS